MVFQDQKVNSYLQPQGAQHRRIFLQEENGYSVAGGPWVSNTESASPYRGTLDLAKWLM